MEHDGKRPEGSRRHSTRTASAGNAAPGISDEGASNGAKRRQWGRAALVASSALVLAVSLAACGSDSDGDSGASGGDAKSEKYTFAFNSTPDPSYLPVLMAIDAMKEDGWNMESTQTQSDSVSFQLMSADRAQFTFTNLADGAGPVNEGAPLKAVAGVDANATTWVSQEGLTDCADLDGKPVGIYAPHEGYTLIQEAYFEKECPGVEPNLVVIPDSALRAQALANGRIDGSVLGTSDAYQLAQKFPEMNFNQVAMGPELAGAGDSYIWTNERTIADNPEAVEAFLAAMLTATRSIYENPDQLPDLVDKYFDSSQLPVTQLYADSKLWYANGNLTGVEPTLTLFSVDGSYDDIVDDAPLEATLADLGESDLTEH